MALQPIDRMRAKQQMKTLNRPIEPAQKKEKREDTAFLRMLINRNYTYYFRK